MNEQQLINNYQAIKSQIPNHVTLLAVSKTKPSEMIKTLAGVGQSDFGENYVQEAIAKINELKNVTANRSFGIISDTFNVTKPKI